MSQEHADQAQRLFLILDPATRMAVDTCTGPDAAGACPRATAAGPPCRGYRVLPLRGTDADGLPFSVLDQDGSACPLAWAAQ